MHLVRKPLKFQYYGSYFQVKWPSQMDRGAKTLKFGRAKRVLRLYIYFDFLIKFLILPPRDPREPWDPRGGPWDPKGEPWDP